MSERPLIPLPRRADIIERIERTDRDIDRDRDRKDYVNQKAARELCARIPGAQFQSIPKAGHELNREAPEALGHAVDDFFCSLP